MTWDEDAVIAAARDLRARTGGADILFAFASADFREHLAAFVEILQVEGHARRVVGCSADSLIGTGREEENASGFSALSLRVPGMTVRTWVIDEAFQIPRDQPAGGAWIILGHPGKLNARFLLEDLTAQYPGTPVFGGMASGGWEAGSIFQFHDGTDATDAAGIAVHLSGVKVAGLVSQGCQPVGEPYTITRAEEDIVYAVGGRPAYEVLTETFEKLPEKLKSAAQAGNLMAGIAASEYIHEFRRGDFLVRNILGGDPASGGIKIGAEPRVGQTLQFQLRERSAADEDLRQRCAETLLKHGVPVAGLLFTCGGRGQHLFQTPNHDAGLLAESFGAVPLAGFFANGEFGPVAGVNFMHGYTASAALIYPA
jgi:small ligand-binding sensory domain FIST